MSGFRAIKKGLPSGIDLSLIAANLGVDKSTVSRWFSKRIPAERVNEIARITGIPREVLRPDVFAEVDP